MTRAGFFTVLAATLVTFTVGAVERSDCLDMMEAAVGAYTPERRLEYVEQVEKNGITEHGFARLTSNIGVLVANGRMESLRDEFIRMMDICAREQPIAHKRNGATRTGHHAVGSEFAVKELVFAVQEAEKSGKFPKEKTDSWRAAFSSMKAEDIYSVKPEPGLPTARNWTIFGAASEQARIAAGMGGDPQWVEKCVSDQLRFFDENGMYRDPGCPVVYDFVTRLQYAAVLSCGYDGPSRAKIEEAMERAAEPTLMMQSVTGEIPFGGRSNQFLHNETCYAALCEWYAARDAKRGNIKRAKRFRAASERAFASVRRHLEENGMRHVKNCFPQDSMYGCERYGYFDKYMVTMGSWAYLAFRFADTSVTPATEKEKDSVFATSPEFHRVMMNAGDWTLEFDRDAQEGYDASGLGRIMKRGAPSPIALSVPFPSKPRYKLDVTNEFPTAIGPRGIAKFSVEKASAGEVVLSYPDGRWKTVVDADGVTMTVEQKGNIVFSLPAFAFDGKTHTAISRENDVLSINYRGWVCRYSADAEIVDTGKTLGNRNGRYRLFEVRAKDKARIRVEIEKVADVAQGMLIMDSDMNRFDPVPSKFSNSRFVKSCGFNARSLQVDGTPLAVTALFDKYDSRVFPEGSEAREWVLASRKKFAEKIKEVKSAGLAVFVNTDVIVLPRIMKKLYGKEICGEDGRIDFMKPKTQEIYRAMIAEWFETFPELDGIVVRTGETYTFKTPYHGGNGPCNYGKDIKGSKVAHAALMNLLREEICEKRERTVIYRTWDFGFFHVRPGYYLDVTKRVKPHDKFIISVKHVASDFVRGAPFNPTLGIGTHRQIVEVQCQREYEGKGAFPMYVASSVIDGFEEHEGAKGCGSLRELSKSPLFAGVWTWSRGGGWNGPFIKNEIWLEINARVMSNWANDISKSEKEAFNEAAAALGVLPESFDKFHRLCLLSPKAILRGKSATHPEGRRGLTVMNIRDVYIAGFDQFSAGWFHRRIKAGAMDGILADRRESVKIWEEIVSLAAEVKCRDKAMEDYILTSSLYGLRLFRMIEAGWDVMATGVKGDMSEGKYDVQRLKDGIARFDRARAAYFNLPKERPDTATLFTDHYARIGVSDGRLKISPVPGIAESVDRYRGAAADSKPATINTGK